MKKLHFSLLVNALIGMLILISGFSPVSAGTETEPNNLLGLSTPLTIGENFTGTIGTRGDVDFYKVSLPTSGRLTCSVTNSPANLRMYLHLYNRDADYMWQRVAAVNDGDDIFHTVDIIDPGTYFIKVEDSDRDTSDQPYTLLASFISVADPTEPNNEIGNAAVLTGAPVSATIFDRNDKDFFSIYAKKDDVLDMTVTAPETMTSYLDLYNSNMDYMWVRDGAENPGDLLNLTHTVTEDGVYYIRVRDSRNASMTQPYTLNVTGGSPDSQPVETSVTNEVEPNDEIRESNLIDIDKTVSGALSTEGDKDWYKVTIPATGKLKIDLSKVPANIQPTIRLYNQSKNQILSGQPTDPGNPVTLFYNVTNPGVYYIQLYNLDNKVFSQETYEISTALTIVNDMYEPNDDYGDAKLLNQQNRINAYIFGNNDSDWYKVKVQQPGDLKIILTDLPDNIVPRIDLYNLSKSGLAGKTGVKGTDLELVHPITETGTYLIKIRGNSGNASTIPYTLTVFGAQFDSFAPIAGIDRIDPGSIVVGDTIHFNGSGTDADGTVTGYAWRSDIDGMIGNTASFSTTSLSIGTHTVYFKVQDNDGIWSTETSEVVYVGSSVSDETEPNDTLASADEIAFGRPVKAKIDVANDKDYYKIYVPGPGHVTLSATNIPAKLKLYLELFNRHYDYLWIRNKAVSEGDDVVLEFDAVEPGFYFLRISDTHGEFDADFAYTLTLTHDAVNDPYENNNSLLDAHLLSTGTVEAYIFPGGPDDHDYYKVWVEKDSTLNVSITQTPSNLKPYIELYDRNGSYMWVRRHAENDGDTIDLSHVFDTSGYVYIRIRDTDGDYNWTETYKANITGAVFGHLPSDPVVSTENEDNGEISKANLMAPGTPVSGTIGTNGDLDWFRIHVPSPCIMHTALTSMAVRGRLRIYDNVGNQIGYREATNPGDDLLINTEITRPGTYRIMLDGPDGTISSLPYNLNTSFTFAVDNYEPNDRFGDSAVLSDSNSITALIFEAGDEDWYRVTSQTGSTLKAVLTDVPREIKPKIDIYDFNYDRVASKTATNDGQELILAHDVTATGHYYIRISDVENNSSTQPYSLTINGAVFNTYIPVAIIESVLPNPAQDNDAVTMTGHGEDIDGTIAGASWRSSIDGVIGASESITISSLTVGVHDLYFKVMDNDGNWSRETKTRLYFGMPAPQESEPNNRIGEATPIEFATQYAGVISPKNDVDFFSMQVPGPGILTISSDNPVGSQMRTYLETYDKNADYTWIRTSANTAGDPLTLEYVIESSGIYFLKISDANGTEDSAYTFSVTFTPAPDPYEPNGDAWRSTEISANETVQAYIFPKGDKDWYKVTVDTPGTLAMSLTDMPSDLRGYIETYNPDLGYTWIRANALNDGEEVFLSYDLPEAGTYWIRVSDNGGNQNASEPYTFTTAFIPAPDPFEPNHEFYQATKIAKSPVKAYIFPKGDKDWYYFYADTGSTLVIKGDTLPPDVRLNLRLYKANSEYLWKEAYSPNPGEDVELTYDVTTSGYYYLRVEGRDSTYAAGDAYRLSISGANLTDPPVDTPVTVEAEPNDDFDVANKIGMDPVTGTLTASGDDDWYYLPFQGPGILTVSLTVPPSVRSRIEIYNGNKSRVTGRDAENKGDTSVLTYNIPEAGNWYVRVLDQDNSESTEAYTLDIDFTPAADEYEPNNDYSHAHPVNLGETITPVIFPDGDQDWFTYEVTQPGIMQFTIQQIPENIQIGMNVYDENYTKQLGYEVKNSGDPLLTSLRVDSPGTYYVCVYASNGASAASKYALKVLLSPLEDSTEPNDTFSDATMLETDNRVSGLIFPANDQDWYSFTMDTAGLIRVQVAQTQGFEPVIVLYNDSKDEIAKKTAKNKGDGLLLEHDIAQPDRYYLRLYDSGGNDISDNPYVLTIEGGSFTRYSPMASIDNLTANPAIQGDTVTLTGSGTDQDGTLQGYEWSSSRDGVIGYTETLSTSTLTPGDHRIGLRVQDDQGNWSAVVYRNLYVTDQILEEAEVNDNLDSFPGANPVPLGTWITGTIQPGRDADFYKIYVKTRGWISALVDAVPANMKSYIEFYNQDHDYMWERNSANNPGDWVQHTIFAEPGWYYAKISDNASSSYTNTYGVRFSYTPAPDLYEPNDSLSTATVIVPDAVIDDALISHSGEKDYYRMDITGPGRLNLSLTQNPGEMKGYIELFNPDLGYMWVRNSANHPGEDVFLTHDIETPGTYYIRISDSDNMGHTSPYTFTYGFIPVEDPYEDNPNFGSAVQMPKDSIDGYIFPGGDQDWYRVYAEKDAVLSMSVTQIPATMRPSIRMYNKNKGDMWVHNDANNDGDPVYLQYTADESSFYYIRIVDSNNQGYVDPYTLTIAGGSSPPAENPQQVEKEPNADIGDATLIEPNQNISGTINPEDDHDWYKVHINSPGILEISHTDIPAEVTSRMWVYNYDKSEIEKRFATNPGEDNILTLTVASPGIYYVEVADETGDHFSTDTYSLRVNHTPVVDGHEPNQNYGSATPMGQTSVTGYLFDQDDEDWYRVYVRDPGSLSLSLTVVPEDLRPRLTLYNAEKDEKETKVNTNAGIGGDDLIVHDVQQPGFYFIQVDDEDNGYSANSYTLVIGGADFSTAPLLSPIGNKTIDETISYAFTVNAFDPDNPMDLVFSATGLPEGAAFDPATRTFTWTPERGQRGDYSGITFTVSDGTYADSETITITVDGLSRAPVLAPIGNKSVPVGETLTFTLSATDADGDPLTYSLELPSGTTGATLDGNTFTWTPADNQAETHTDILFKVTDGTWTDFEYIDIEVTTTVPHVSTGDISDISETTVKVTGEVSMSGGDTVTERGVVYATHDSPTVDDSGVSPDNAGTGTYAVNLTGLEKGTEYYVRAYAVNSNGTAYGEIKRFSTTLEPVPMIQVTPQSADFGQVRKQNASAPKRFTITNDGNADLEISDIGITGENSDEFMIQNDLCSNKTIAPSETGTFEVIFSPLAVGRRTATLTIPSNDPDTDVLTVEIVGEGLPIKGDINNDGNVDMQDAILALQVLRGEVMQPDAVYLAADVNGDNVIGVHEVIYILNFISETSE